MESWGKEEERIKMTIGDWIYFIFAIAIVGAFIWGIVISIQEARLPQEIKDKEEFIKNKTEAIADAKRYCIETNANECQVCIKKGYRKCDVYITLRGREIEEFVNSQ